MAPNKLVKDWNDNQTPLKVRTMTSAEDVPCLVVESVDGSRALVLEFDGKDFIWPEVLPREVKAK